MGKTKADEIVVETKCPHCGSGTSTTIRRALRRVKCASCSKKFTPVREGIICPRCKAVVIMPTSGKRFKVSCLECRLVMWKPRPWHKRKWQVMGLIAAVILSMFGFVMLRHWLNMRLAAELRAKYQAWLGARTRPGHAGEGAMGLIYAAAERLKNSAMPEAYCSGISIDSADGAQLADGFIICNVVALQQIHEALQGGSSQYQWRRSEGTSGFSRRDFDQVAGLLAMTGELARWQKRTDRALEEFLNILRLACVVGWSEPGCKGKVAETDVSRVGLRMLSRMVSTDEISEKTLADALRGILVIYPLRREYRNVIEREYMKFCGELAGTIENYRWQSHWRMNEDWDLIRMSPYLHDYGDEVEAFKATVDRYLKAEPGRFHEVPQELRETNAFKRGILGELEQRGMTAAAREMPNFAAYFTTLACDEMFWRGTIALAAVRLFEARNGRLPQSLDEASGLLPEEMLVDPFSGRQFVYTVAGDDFRLYSVWLDGVDDTGAGAGDYLEMYSRSTYDAGIDIVFHKPASAQVREGEREGK
jgi:hypothetical protein